MGIKFNADEVLQMACQIERNGSKFYRDAQAKLKDSRADVLLLKLAEQEDEH